MNTNTNQKYFTVKQVQQILFGNALSVTSVYVMVRKGIIPSVQYLNKRLIPAAWVEQELKKAVDL